MKFVLSIDCDGAAFSDGDGEDVDAEDVTAEIAECLKRVVRRLQTSWTDLDETNKIVDSNGNSVGTWVIES